MPELNVHGVVDVVKADEEAAAAAVLAYVTYLNCCILLRFWVVVDDPERATIYGRATDETLAELAGGHN